jgi:hypothetical protein
MVSYPISAARWSFTFRILAILPFLGSILVVIIQAKWSNIHIIYIHTHLSRYLTYSFTKTQKPRRNEAKTTPQSLHNWILLFFSPLKEFGRRERMAVGGFGWGSGSKQGKNFLGVIRQRGNPAVCFFQGTTSGSKKKT